MMSLTDQQNRIHDFKKKCRERSLKVTPQRLAVFKALLEAEDHPCAERLFRRLRPDHPNISLDTVNRTLLTLAEMSLATVVEGTGEAKRFDANLENHQHFRCVKCKRIIDFHHAPFDNVPVPSNLSSAFTVLRKTVYLEGICDQCRSSSQEKS